MQRCCIVMTTAQAIDRMSFQSFICECSKTWKQDSITCNSKTQVLQTSQQAHETSDALKQTRTLQKNRRFGPWNVYKLYVFSLVIIPVVLNTWMSACIHFFVQNSHLSAKGPNLTKACDALLQYSKPLAAPDPKRANMYM